MSEAAKLADHIDRQSGDILAHWRAAVGRDDDLPGAARLDRSEFDDHVPALLDRIAERLRGRPADPGVEGRIHGGHRWRQGYDIAEVVTELGHLRDTLARATGSFARSHGWDLARFEAAVAALNDVLDEATAESVRQFQEDGLAEADRALEEARSRQKSTEEAWREAKLERSKLRSILRSLPIAVWVFDPDGTVRGTNYEAERMQGVDPTPGGPLPNLFQLGASFQMHYPDGTACPVDRLPAVRALRGETVIEEEYLWPLGDEPRTIAVNASPLTDAAGEVIGAVAVAVDLTGRKRLEDALLQQRAAAEEASRHKTRLVSALSHDVRTPLNAVILAAQLLDANLAGTENPEVAQCLRSIRHSARNVIDLLKDLLDLTKLDAGGAAVEPTRFPAEAVLAECLASVEPQARLKGLDVRLDPGPLAGATLETDRSKLKQVLCNLLSNAVRYTEAGHVRLYGAVDDGWVRLSVEDTGVGIDPADQPRVFDEFAVLDNPVRQVGEGTGLGLAICRRLAGLLGGEVRLTSAPGDGSTFTLALPASTLVPSAPPPREGPAGDAGSDGAGAVVVAEDHADSRQTLAKVLRRMGYQALEAGDGRAALDAARRAGSDLRAVLMDVNMPGMDGVEATLALRADAALRHLPIFALTGDVSAENQQRIAEAGVDGFLEKPVTWEALRDALDSVAGRVKPA
jgi:signal transduction histidine kinase/CheY-like chemotaxis protein